MKTILRIMAAGATEKTIVRNMEIVPEKKDFLLIHEPFYHTAPKETLSFHDYDYCKHEVTDRTWHMYEDHIEADILLSKCNRQDKCVFDEIKNEDV